MRAMPAHRRRPSAAHTTTICGRGACGGTLIAIVAMVLGGVSWAASGVDLRRCATVENNDDRLACYDALVAAPRAAGTPDGAELREPPAKIIARCRAEMGTYGSAMVKACVDEDVEALRRLNTYPQDQRPFIERCRGEMGRYGWAMVKACADEDIEAEKALGRMTTD